LIRISIPDVLSFSEKSTICSNFVKVKAGIKTNVSGTGFNIIMVCNDSKCLPPVKKSFDLKLPITKLMKKLFITLAVVCVAIIIY
jgi:hypothetical protein